MQEAKGFQGDIGKDKARNKVLKQDAKSQKEKRRQKIQKLSQDDKHWKGLESADIRTPTAYFQNRQELEERLSTIKTKLNDLQSHLQSLKQKKAETPAAKSLKQKEVSRTEQTLEKRRRLVHASQIVDEVASGNDDKAATQMREHLDYHLHKKLESYFELAGEEIEEQIFGDK